MPKTLLLLLLYTKTKLLEHEFMRGHVMHYSMKISIINYQLTHNFSVLTSYLLCLNTFVVLLCSVYISLEDSVYAIFCSQLVGYFAPPVSNDTMNSRDNLEVYVRLRVGYPVSFPWWTPSEKVLHNEGSRTEIVIL